MPEDNKTIQNDNLISSDNNGNNIEELWVKLTKNKLDGETLCDIINNVPGLSERAWAELLKIGPNNKDLLLSMLKNLGTKPGKC